MKKVSKRLLSVLMVLMMLVPSISMIAQAANASKIAENTVTFDLDDLIEGEEGQVDVSADKNGDLAMNFSGMSKESPIVYNEEDSKYDAGSNLSYVGTMRNSNMGLYKVEDASNVHIVEGEDDTVTEAESYLDACLEQKPMTTSELRSFFSLSNHRANPNTGLLFNDPVGVEENHTSKMRMVNESNAASKSVVVLDDDSIAIFIKDTDGNIVKDAYVTIRYTDLNNKAQTRTTITDAECGAVVFDKMKGIYFIAVDIQHKDYRSKTSLNVEVEPGEAIEKIIEPVKDDDLYIRCADLEGLDMMEYVGDITISDADLFKQSLNYTIMVTKNGNKTLPSTVNLCAENAGEKRVVKKFQKTSNVYSDGDSTTGVYTCSANWVSDELFKKGDVISYDIEPTLLKAGKDGSDSGSGSSTETKITVDDAKSRVPKWTTVRYGFLDGILTYTLPDSVPGIGGTSIGAELFNCPLNFAVLADGSVFMSYGIDLSGGKKTKEMVESSWIPAKSEQTKKCFTDLYTDTSSKIAQFKDEKDVFFGCGAPITSYSGKVKSTMVFSGVGNYDKETNRVSVRFGAIVNVTGSFGVTWYVAIPVGPAVFPGYAGFETSAAGSAGGYLTLSMDIKKQTIEEMLGSLRIEFDDDGESGICLDVILSLSAYVGVGFHGIASISITGSVYMDLGLDLVSSGMVEYKKNEPRFRVTGGYRVDLTAKFLWFKANKKVAGKNGWLYDSWGIYGKSDEAKKLAAAGGVQYEKIDLEASQSQLTKMVSNGDNSGIEKYRLKSTLKAGNSSETTLVDTKTLDGGSPRFIQTEIYSVLFRMMPIDGKVRVCYQLMDIYGNLSNIVNVLPLPDRDESQKNNDVTEFDVIAGEGNKIAIAMIGCNSDEDDVTEKARSTYSVAETLDLDTGSLTYRVTNTNRKWCDNLSNPVAIYNPEKNTCGCIGTESKSEDPCTNYYSDDFLYSEMHEASQPVIYFQNQKNTEKEPITLSCDSVDNGYVRYYGELGDDNHDEDKCANPTYYKGLLGFNYKTLTGKDWDGKSPIISYSRTVGERTYVVIDGKLYYLTYTKNHAYNRFYSLNPVKYANGEQVAFADAEVYDIQKGVEGNVCFTALSSNYDSDGNCTGSTLHVYRITDPDTNPVIHGPQEIKLDVKEPSNFTALPESPTGACVAFYTIPIAEEKTEDGVTDAAQLYQWNQKPFAQAKIEAVALTQKYISAKDTKMPFKVVCKNYGTNRIDRVKVVLYLEDTQYYMSKSFDVNIYQGDEEILDLTDIPRPASWNHGIHKLGVRTDIEGDLFTSSLLTASASTDDMYTVELDSSYLTLDIDTRFVGGSHKAFVTISNESMVASQTPVLQLVGKFKKISPDDTNNERVIKNIELPIRQLTDADYSGGNAQGIKYNTSFDLDEIWNQYSDGEDILYSITAKLVPKSVANGRVTGEEAEKLCNSMPESVYIANPNISRVVNINANPNALIMGKVDGNGIYNIGDTVKLTAMPSAGHKFLGWYNGDELISKDVELTFNAKENVNLVAKFAPTVNAVQVDDVKMNYKSTLKLNTVVDADDGTQYAVTYTTSNPNIVSVDVDGNVTALKRGNAVVTCTVTDIYGNQKQDTCLVTVKYSPWQWLIKTVLFGWIWY